MKVQIALALFLIAISINFASADRYAVLVAGSNGWENYRHQADVCHGYLSLLDKGVPASNIIMFSYNDVASSSSNPFPNKLFNAPSNTTGWDVNKGCVIDYQGNDVTSTNYLNVLLGNATALKGVGTGRVLKSTSADEVFLAFYDHGGSGLIAFPNDYLYANDFQATLKKMHTDKKYKQLVYYMEACESGSMWTGFPSTLNLYALSAANATESSWATYCPASYGMNDGGSIVNGVDLGVCLGDLFSVNWMQNLDQANTLEETLEQQYTIVEKQTNLSHVLQWGQKTFTSEFISDVFGTTNSKFRPGAPSQRAQDLKISSAINSRLVKLRFYERQYRLDPTNEAKKQAYDEVVAENTYFTNVFTGILNSGDILPSEGPLVIQNYDCLKNLVNSFESNCRKFTDFGLQYVSVLAQLCENSVLEGDAAKMNLVTSTCKNVESQQQIAYI